MTPQPATPPSRVILEGRYARLEPITPAHEDALFAVATVPDADQRFTYFPSYPPRSIDETRAWIAAQQTLADPIVFAVIDKASGRVGGWQQMMRIDAPNGVIEIGYVYWGPSISRTRVATEALYLFARHVFEDLGYRRFEWKCNNANEPSKAAALRFGFTYEGLFRQHMIVKGRNRDTAWFSMLDHEWPTLKTGFVRWLDPSNFDAAGKQKTRLTFS